MKMETLKQQILTAKGDVRAELVLKNARVINVFTNEIEQADVAICQGVILGVGHYTGETELDLQGKYVCPGLVDGHIHIESSMLCGPAFEQAVLPHGTTAVVTDPHEISNVAGTAGLDFMLETTKDLALSVYFMLPSCVPATGLDESGAVLEAEQLRPYYQQPRVLGLAGMALASTPLLFLLSTGVLIGAAQAGTTYAVVYGVIGRNIAPERRSWAMGVAAAAGSFGQFLMVPTEGWHRH